jgi:hypothetical protein
VLRSAAEDFPKSQPSTRVRVAELRRENAALLQHPRAGAEGGEERRVVWSLVAERQPSADDGSGLPRCCVIQQMVLLLFLLRRRWCVLLHTTSPFTSRQHPRIHSHSLWPVAPSSHDVGSRLPGCLHSACDGD